MNLIQSISEDTLQHMNVPLADNSFASLTLYFIPMQQCWVIQNLTYANFAINNLRISNSPNMLLQFMHQIPFGIACFSQGDREPSLQQDFSSGASKLFLLTKADCELYVGFLTGA